MGLRLRRRHDLHRSAVADVSVCLARLGVVSSGDDVATQTRELVVDAFLQKEQLPTFTAEDSNSRLSTAGYALINR